MLLVALEHLGVAGQRHPANNAIGAGDGELVHVAVAAPRQGRDLPFQGQLAGLVASLDQPLSRHH